MRPLPCRVLSRTVSVRSSCGWWRQSWRRSVPAIPRPRVPTSIPPSQRAAQGCTACRSLWPLTFDGRRAFLADMGVYTRCGGRRTASRTSSAASPSPRASARNRAFRLLHSSKYGKVAVLRVAEDNAFPVDDSSAAGELALFRASLVSCFVDGALRAAHERPLLTVVQRPPACCTRSATATPPQLPPQLPPRLLPLRALLPPAARQPLLPLHRAARLHGATNAQVHRGRRRAVAALWVVRPARLIPQHRPRLPAPSFLPELDDFVRSLVNIGGKQGTLRCWSCLHALAPPCVPRLLVYEIARNRWCRRVGRAHKSNHVMIVADLEAGVAYQRCHDPECAAADYRCGTQPRAADAGER